MQWQRIQPNSVVVVLGRPEQGWLQQCLAAKPAKIVVFDAAADASAGAAAKEAKKLPKNETTAFLVKPQLVAPAAGQVDFYQYNLSHLNAVAPANAELKKLFPGLKQLSVSKLKAVAVHDAVQSLQLSGYHHMLVLAMPASNAKLLTALAEQGDLSLFNHLVVQHGAEPLYQGMASLQQFEQSCAELGYQPVSSDHSDPDFPVLQFYRDALVLELEQTKQVLKQVKQLENDLKQQSELLAVAKKEVQATGRQYKKTIDDQRLRVETLKNEKEAMSLKLQELTKENNERKLLNESLKQERDRLALQSKERQEKRHELERSMAQLQQENTELKAVQRRMQDDITRADAQLELIKELALRENAI